jgi:type I restriction enzyme S subunit
MEVRPGYKQTDVGIIPDEWDVKSVRELARVRTGPFGTLLKAREYSDSEGVPLISVGEIGVGRFRVTEATPRVPDVVVRRLPEYVLRTGDVVFGRKGAVERSALVTEAETGWFLGSDGIAIRPRDGCYPPYLAAQFQSHDVQGWLFQNATGTTMASLNQEILGRVQVRIAPLPEQRAVADALTDVDALLVGLDRLIAKQRDIKEAAMRLLLTGQTRLPGFCAEWDEVAFGDIATIRNAKVIGSSTPAGTHCIELESISQGTGRLVGIADDPGMGFRYSFKKGDVLFGRLRAYLRKYWFATFDGVCSTEIWPLIPRDERLTGRFLFLLVQTAPFMSAAGVSYGTHMPRSDWSVLKELQTRLPPPPEQQAIAAVFFDMEAELTALEARRDKTRDLKQAMMQELLTGKTRLHQREPANV